MDEAKAAEAKNAELRFELEAPQADTDQDIQALGAIELNVVLLTERGTKLDTFVASTGANLFGISVDPSGPSCARLRLNAIPAACAALLVLARGTAPAGSSPQAQKAVYVDFKITVSGGKPVVSRKCSVDLSTLYKQGPKGSGGARIALLLKDGKLWTFGGAPAPEEAIKGGRASVIVTQASSARRGSSINGGAWLQDCLRDQAVLGGQVAPLEAAIIAALPARTDAGKKRQSSLQPSPFKGPIKPGRTSTPPGETSGKLAGETSGKVSTTSPRRSVTPTGSSTPGTTPPLTPRGSVLTPRSPRDSVLGDSLGSLHGLKELAALKALHDESESSTEDGSDTEEGSAAAASASTPTSTVQSDRKVSSAGTAASSKAEIPERGRSPSGAALSSRDAAAPKVADSPAQRKSLQMTRADASASKAATISTEQASSAGFATGKVAAAPAAQRKNPLLSKSESASPKKESLAARAPADEVAQTPALQRKSLELAKSDSTFVSQAENPAAQRRSRWNGSQAASSVEETRRPSTVLAEGQAPAPVLETMSYNEIEEESAPPEAEEVKSSEGRQAQRSSVKMQSAGVQEQAGPEEAPPLAPKEQSRPAAKLEALPQESAPPEAVEVKSSEGRQAQRTSVKIQGMHSRSTSPATQALNEPRRSVSPTALYAELAELKSTHLAAKQEAESRLAAEKKIMKDSHNSALQAQADQHATALSDVEQKHAKTLEELEALRSSSATALQESTTQNNGKIQKMLEDQKARADAASEELRAANARQLQEQQETHKKALKDQEAMHAAKTEELLAAHANQQEEQQETHKEALKDQEAMHAAKTEELLAAHANQKEEQQLAHAAELESLKSSHVASTSSHAAALKASEDLDEKNAQLKLALQEKDIFYKKALQDFKATCEAEWKNAMETQLEEQRVNHAGALKKALEAQLQEHKSMTDASLKQSLEEQQRTHETSLQKALQEKEVQHQSMLEEQKSSFVNLLKEQLEAKDAKHAKMANELEAQEASHQNALKDALQVQQSKYEKSLSDALEEKEALHKARMEAQNASHKQALRDSLKAQSESHSCAMDLALQEQSVRHTATLEAQRTLHGNTLAQLAKAEESKHRLSALEAEKSKTDQAMEENKRLKATIQELQSGSEQALEAQKLAHQEALKAADWELQEVKKVHQRAWDFVKEAQGSKEPLATSRKTGQAVVKALLDEFELANLKLQVASWRQAVLAARASKKSGAAEQSGLGPGRMRLESGWLPKPSPVGSSEAMPNNGLTPSTSEAWNTGQVEVLDSTTEGLARLALPHYGPDSEIGDLVHPDSIGEAKDMAYSMPASGRSATSFWGGGTGELQPVQPSSPEGPAPWALSQPANPLGSGPLAGADRGGFRNQNPWTTDRASVDPVNIGSSRPGSIVMSPAAWPLQEADNPPLTPASTCLPRLRAELEEERKLSRSLEARLEAALSGVDSGPNPASIHRMRIADAMRGPAALGQEIHDDIPKEAVADPSDPVIFLPIRASVAVNALEEASQASPLSPSPDNREGPVVFVPLRCQHAVMALEEAMASLSRSAEGVPGTEAIRSGRLSFKDTWKDSDSPCLPEPEPTPGEVGIRKSRQTGTIKWKHADSSPSSSYSPDSHQRSTDALSPRALLPEPAPVELSVQERAEQLSRLLSPPSPRTALRLQPPRPAPADGQ